MKKQLIGIMLLLFIVILTVAVAKNRVLHVTPDEEIVYINQN